MQTPLQTLTLHETIGDDGVLRLQVPAQPRGASVEVVVVIQAQSNGSKSNGNGSSPTREEQNRSWVEATYGSLQDPTFEIPEELPWETNRLPIE